MMSAKKNDKESVPATEENIKETVSESEEVRISPRTGKPIQKKYAPKNKRKAGGGAKWLKPENMYKLEPGDNTKFMTVNAALVSMPDIDMNDAEQVAKRLNDFFMLYAENDMKPTVAGMALALNNMHRSTLYDIAYDRPTGGNGYKTSLPQGVANLIKKAYKISENLWETYMLQGKINPPSGIFLGKNHYGYRDESKLVLSPGQPQDSDFSAEDIRQRYLTDEAEE